jgi:hypothetical protein
LTSPALPGFFVLDMMRVMLVQMHTSRVRRFGRCKSAAPETGARVVDGLSQLASTRISEKLLRLTLISYGE